MIEKHIYIRIYALLTDKGLGDKLDHTQARNENFQILNLYKDFQTLHINCRF